MPLIVIVGINGRQGTSVAEAFMDAPGFLIRGLTSSPDCPASERWKEMGVEIREETWVDEEHIKASFEGATVIFALTSYHAPFEDRRAKLALEVGLIHTSMARFAMQRDVYIARMLFNAAAATPGLRRLVMSTLPVVKDGTRYAAHMAQSVYLAKKQQIYYLENCLPALLDKTIMVKPCMRMEDYRVTLRMSEDGTLSFGTTAPAHVPVPWINMKDDFGIFVRAFVGKLPLGFLNIAAFSDRVSGEDICALISKISGIPCAYRQYGVDEVEALGKNLASEMLPDPSGSVLYDPNVFTVGSFNEAFKGHGEPIRQSSFEDYLKTVLPGHIASLRATSNEEAGSYGQAAPSKQKDSPLAVFRASRSDGGLEIGNAVLHDVFMGYSRDDALLEE